MLRMCRGLIPLRNGLGRRKLVRLVCLNKIQPVLSQICNYRPLSIMHAYRTCPTVLLSHKHMVGEGGGKHKLSSNILYWSRRFYHYYIFPGTYDLKAIRFKESNEGTLELKCIFVKGSQSLGCQVELCRKHSCTCQSINNDGTMASKVSELQTGLYTIKKVAIVASNDRVTVLNQEALEFSDIFVTQAACSCQSSWIAFGMS